MSSAAEGLSMFFMKISKTRFLFSKGTNLQKTYPKTDLLWNWAYNLLDV
jgi:hypothetical protein